MSTKDWTRGKIRYELEKRGILTWREIDYANDFPPNTISNTIYRPDPRGERVISDILGVPPQVIWPSRYDASGQRRKPQPANQRRAEANARHRQKLATA